MKQKFLLLHLYSKKVLSHGAFRVYRLLLDIRNGQSVPSPIKASRRSLMNYTGLSENALKSALKELIRLKIVLLKSDRPSLWWINDPSEFDTEALSRLASDDPTDAKSEDNSADFDDK